MDLPYRRSSPLLWVPLLAAARVAWLLPTPHGKSYAFHSPSPMAGRLWREVRHNWLGIRQPYTRYDVDAHRSVARNVVAEPPTRTRPPDVADDVLAQTGEWTECLVNDPDTAQSGLHVETWVFRRIDYNFFQQFLKLRGFQHPDQLATVQCRNRQIDAEIKCAQCIRLLQGGCYGNEGVSVPAYPPQKDAVGCLATSKLLTAPAPSTDDLKFGFAGLRQRYSNGTSKKKEDLGDWDGDQGRQTAFCNSVNARFESMEA